MVRPSPILIIALISAIGGIVFLATSLSGNNNWFTDRISSPTVYPGLLPIADAIGKDLMLDVSPQLHPSVFVGESANQVAFEHWIDAEIHCEDCLRLVMPRTGDKVGVAFSSTENYNFEEATKVSFYVMPGEEGGETLSFRAVGNDRDNSNSTNIPADDLFVDQEFALTSQNVTLNQSWNYFEISLDGVQEKLTSVKYPFAFELAEAQGNIIYIKGITYSNEPILDRYLLEAAPSENLTASMMTITTVPTNATELDVTLSDNATETVNASATVEFNASVANGEEPYSFDWNFGDGARDTQDTDGIALHTFASPGSYNVTVDVVDSLNNTGSASTIVDVADEIIDEGEPLLETSEGNLTQDSQTTDSLNTTNTTAGDSTAAADGNENLTEDEADDGGNTTDNLTEVPDGEASSDPAVNNSGNDSTSPSGGVNGESTSSITDTNSPPVANAGYDLTGKPTESVILDASKSTDPDDGDRIESYQWEQVSGPTAVINDENSQTPIVTLPDIDNDATLVFSLTVNDGEVNSEEQDTVSIHVDHTDELTGNVQAGSIEPADVRASEWIVSGECAEQGQVECLSDGSGATFVTAGVENIDAVNLYSFRPLNVGTAVVDPNSLVIERVMAEITAKKLGNTGYLSFAIDDPREEEHYITPSVSVGSSSFQNYYHVWDANPLTGDRWTYDSLSSVIAGFKYDGGQSGVQISEIKLIISYSMPEPEPSQPPAEASQPPAEASQPPAEASQPPAEADPVDETSIGEPTQNVQNEEDNTDVGENPDGQEQVDQGPVADEDEPNSTGSDEADGESEE